MDVRGSTTFEARLHIAELLLPPEFDLCSSVLIILFYYYTMQILEISAETFRVIWIQMEGCGSCLPEKYHVKWALKTQGMCHSCCTYAVIERCITGSKGAAFVRMCIAL